MNHLPATVYPNALALNNSVVPAVWVWGLQSRECQWFWTLLQGSAGFIYSGLGFPLGCTRRKRRTRVMVSSDRLLFLWCRGRRSDTWFRGGRSNWFL